MRRPITGEAGGEGFEKRMDLHGSRGVRPATLYTANWLFRRIAAKNGAPVP